MRDHEVRPTVIEIPTDAEADLALIVREMERRDPKR
jgi:hypothetical protein